MTKILCYHGVTKQKFTHVENFSGKHIYYEVFKAQIEYLINHPDYEIISSDLLFKRILNSELTGYEVVITFDDAYYNVFENAWPLLKSYSIPFSLFVSTDHIGSEKIFWVDQIEHWIGTSEKNQIILDIPSYKNGIWRCGSNQERIQTIVELKNVLKRISPQMRNKLLFQIESECASNEDIAKVDNYKCMYWAQLEVLAKYDFVTIGAHTVNHEILSNLTEDQVRYEVSQSKFILEKFLNIKVDSFAYPNGTEQDYTPLCVDILKEYSFRYAFKAVPNSPAIISITDQFAIPRYMVGYDSIVFPFDDY